MLLYQLRQHLFLLILCAFKQMLHGDITVTLRSLHQVVRLHIFCILSALAFIILCRIIGINCPFARIFVIPCPTCGVSRALGALLRFDINDYFRFQPFAVPLTLTAWIIPHLSLFRRKKLLRSVSFAVLVGNVLFYIARLFC